VSKEKKGVVVDARCRDLTNAAVVQKGRDNPGLVDLCDWHEVRVEPFFILLDTDLPKTLGKMEPGKLLPPGIWTLADVMEYGHKHGSCPYFTVRRMVNFAQYSLFTVTKLLPDAVCRRDYIFLPLPTRPESCGPGIEGTRKGCDRSLR
jgi:DNA excision repair protein ERCC-2